MTETVRVIFTPSGRRGDVVRGTSVLDAARHLGVDLASVCGGRGVCSKCQCTAVPGAHPKHGITMQADALSPINAVEEKYDRLRGLPEGRRLGCQAKLMRDAVIDVPPESQVHRQVVRKEADATPITLDPATRLVAVRVAEPDLDTPRGLEQLLAEALAEAWDLPAPHIPLPLLRRLSDVLTEGAGDVTLALHQDAEGADWRVLDLWPGVFTEPLYGLAVDLGSTTLAGHLCDLSSGEVLASAGRMNPQIRFGEDLMSRVSHAMLDPAGAAEMTAAAQDALNDLAADLCREAAIDPRQVVEMTLVCNPVMHHIALGFDPVPLGQAPFALTTDAAQRLACHDLGVHSVNPMARAYVLPLIAGHVGADAAAVALATRPDQADAPHLIVDVGTNAELLLGDRTGVLACSSPTGPAFEGAQITHGQRAAPGAIERVRIDPVTKEPRFRVIGCELWSDEPGFADAIAETGLTGICGSGIIEAVAEMRLAGVLDPSGLIGSAEQTGTDRCRPDGRVQSYLLWDDAERSITVTQSDIRAIQLAKSALYAGAQLLLDAKGIATPARVTLAGAFGAHISPIHALILGMVPDCPTAQITSAGNAAGTGARMALHALSARTQIERLVGEITRIETATQPRFQEHFVAANALPHASAPFAALRADVTLPDVRFGQEGGRRRRRG